MTADEDIEELVIEPIRIVHDLLDLQPRLNIEIVADVTSLKIEIDDADSALTRSLVGLELHSRLERKRRVANAAGARAQRYQGFLSDRRQQRPNQHRRGAEAPCNRLPKARR